MAFKICSDRSICNFAPSGTVVNMTVKVLTYLYIYIRVLHYNL